MNENYKNCEYFSGVTDGDRPVYECMLSGVTCPDDRCCRVRHPIKHFLMKLQYFFNLKNKYHGIQICWIDYKRNIISFDEMLQGMWHELWQW